MIQGGNRRDAKAHDDPQRDIHTLTEFTGLAAESNLAFLSRDTAMVSSEQSNVALRYSVLE